MISWLIGSPAPPWQYLNEMFEDYRNVGVYVNAYGNIEAVKVSDFDEFHTNTSVLLSGYYLLTLKPYYLKLKKFVAFPTRRLSVIKRFLEYKHWRAMEYYDKDKFLVAWVIYDCEDCYEKQRLHLQVEEDYMTDEEIFEKHMQIYSS